MKSIENESVFDAVRGSTIALVYIFEGEQAPGFGHYDIWKSDVISEWMKAVQELNCMPFIIDVRTFISKAMDNTLPKLDYIINLNAGAAEVTALGLVPTIASFLGIPCIPCDTLANLAAEHKKTANLIAKAIDLTMAATLDPSVNNGIYRPLNFGSSKGVKRGCPDTPNFDGIYQEFITGYDITTPIMYNPLSNKMELLPSIMYYSEDKDPNWIFGEDVKAKRSGYLKKSLRLDSKTEQQYLKMVEAIGIYSFCRIDARIKCSSKKEWDSLFSGPVDYEKIFFMEINATPTIKPNINFLNAIDSLEKQDSFFNAYELYKQSNKDATHTGFILACSMIAASKAKYCGKRG